MKLIKKGTFESNSQRNVTWKEKGRVVQNIKDTIKSGFFDIGLSFIFVVSIPHGSIKRDYRCLGTPQYHRCFNSTRYD
ncbi:MAG TPA: hypothetical protein GXZ87_03195 [Bacteroidales bacterium]|nr:hypothetical protein [Bacteroidales bacterium]